MRAKLPVLFLLGSLLPAAAGSSENSPSDRPRLKLVWVDPTSSAVFAYAGMVREARSILGAAGVDVVWDERAAGPLAPEEIAVVVLNGEPVGLPERVMGSVKRSTRSHLWVYPTTVARALGLDTRPSAWSGWEREQVATALGRIVAHEVVHALAPELPHAREGLLSATLKHSQLVSPRLVLDDGSAAALRNGVRLRDIALRADAPPLVLFRSR